MVCEYGNSGNIMETDVKSSWHLGVIRKGKRAEHEGDM
jgi:hypothetical protein